MNVLESLLAIPRVNGKFPALGLTIGNFDGVHLGHRQLLELIKKNCAKNGLTFAVVTFIPHPQKILHPEKERFLINSYEQRRRLLELAGVETLIELKFTRDFSTLTPEEFLQKFLFSYSELKHLYLGYDFAFGANKQGTHDLVMSIAGSRGIEVDVQPAFTFDNNIVSSTLIRSKIFSGQLDEVEAILTRPFTLEGLVIKGEGRGKKIGFPTANIQVSQDLIVPGMGVYVTRTIYKGMTFQSITNIGHNPTFKDTQVIHIETNLFDFDADIYGENLEIEFLKKIRDERKFPTVTDLVEQIKVDVEFSRKYHKST